MPHTPRKRFGQNFLQDRDLIDRIVDTIAARPGQHLVEIGPGRGALTGGLLNSQAQLTALEIDRDLVPQLREQFGRAENFALIEADALKFDFSSLAAPGESLRVVGNLPYNISTPLLFHLLRYRACIADMYFMLQKEVVDRMAASSGDSSYGRLSVMIQYHCVVTPIIHVPPQAFYPAPKVESAVVRLQPRSSDDCVAQDSELLARVVNQAFQQRRKTLRNALKGIITEEALNSIGISSNIRPENLSPADYVRISNRIAMNETGQHD